MWVIRVGVTNIFSRFGAFFGLKIEKLAFNFFYSRFWMNTNEILSFLFWVPKMQRKTADFFFIHR